MSLKIRNGYIEKNNSKLLPRFILELAQAVKNGMYQEKSSQICGEYVFEYQTRTVQISNQLNIQPQGLPLN
jgi:hypothetical protein